MDCRKLSEEHTHRSPNNAVDTIKKAYQRVLGTSPAKCNAQRVRRQRMEDGGNIATNSRENTLVAGKHKPELARPYLRCQWYRGLSVYTYNTARGFRFLPAYEHTPGSSSTESIYNCNRSPRANTVTIPHYYPPSIINVRQTMLGTLTTGLVRQHLLACAINMQHKLSMVLIRIVYENTGL